MAEVISKKTKCIHSLCLNVEDLISYAPLNNELKGVEIPSF